MPDRFETVASGADSPATHGFAITPHDSTDLPEVTRAIYVGAPGSIAAVLLSGADITLTGIAAGTILPLRLRRIKATGTSAAALVGLV
jgi:hypothetical protein